MNTLKKRLTALILFACFSLTAVTGCSNNNSSSSSSKAGETTTEIPIETITNEDGNQVGFPFQSGAIVGNNSISTDSDDPNMFNNKDPEDVDSSPQNISVIVKDENGQPVTETVPVTNAQGQPVTHASGEPVTNEKGENVTQPAGQPVTDAKGEPVTYSAGQTITDNKGQPVTNDSGENVTAAGGETVTSPGGEVVTYPAGQPVTDIVNVTSIADQKPNETNATSGDNSGSSDYKSKTDGDYILWMDISKDEDFHFDGEFVKATFKIKDDIPDGDYPITLETQFSSNAGQSIVPTKVTGGVIRVGGDNIDPADASGSGFQVYGDRINAKRGDTVDVYIRTKNNPGMVAILMWIYYDSNAMERVSLSPAGEFAQVAAKRNTQTGTSAASAKEE